MNGDRCLQGRLLRGIGGFYYVLDDTGTVHTVRAQGKLRKRQLKPKVGDIVTIQPGMGNEDGWILEIKPRENELSRPPVANIGVVLIIVAAASPDPDLLLVDRMLLNARRTGLKARLVVSKCDLAPERARGITDAYRHAGVAPIAVSAVTGEGIDVLRESLCGTIHALAGQSGAGKSSLVNRMYGLKVETGDLSLKIERGKNTTRHCELFPVPGGGMVLDTPGFSLLENEVIEPVQLKQYWPEYLPMEGRCYYSPCFHDLEPGCAVLEALREGKVDPGRHERYRQLLKEMRERWRNRYD